MPHKIKFVVGLGNPGRKYERTPHNLGRRLAESLADQENLRWKHSELFDCTDSEPVFVRLNTFMNLSGEAVLGMMSHFHCEAEEMLVCYDDFDLPFGAIRIRKKGSAGTHNGIKSIVEHLANQNFARLRIGIGPIPPGADPAEFVLHPFSHEHEQSVQEIIGRAVQAIKCAAEKGVDQAMNQFNASTDK